MDTSEHLITLHSVGIARGVLSAPRLCVGKHGGAAMEFQERFNEKIRIFLKEILVTARVEIFCKYIDEMFVEEFSICWWCFF